MKATAPSIGPLMAKPLVRLEPPPTDKEPTPPPPQAERRNNEKIGIGEEQPLLAI